MIVYKKRITTKQSYKKVPAISILIYIKWTKSSYRLLKNNNDKDREDQITELCKDVASIANAEGGYIIIGIQEENKIAKDFINVQNADSICESITQLCLKYIEKPIPYLEVDKKDIEWKGKFDTVIIIHIPPSSEKPHGIKRNNTTFFVKRYGAHIREMSVYEITSNSKGSILDDIERMERIKSKISIQDNALEQRLVETLIYLMELRFQKNFPDIPYYRIIAVPEDLNPDLIPHIKSSIPNILRNPPNIRKDGFGFQGVYKISSTPEGWVGESYDSQPKIILLQNGFIEQREPLLNEHFQHWKDQVVRFANTKKPYFNPDQVAYDLVKNIYSNFEIDESSIPLFDENHNFTP